MGWNSLTNDVTRQPPPNSQDYDKKELAVKVGANMATAEEELMRAYAGQKFENGGWVDVGAGLDAANRNKAVEALVGEKTVVFQRAQRMFTALTQLLETAHQTMMRQIDKIRAN